MNAKVCSRNANVLAEEQRARKDGSQGRLEGLAEAPRVIERHMILSGILAMEAAFIL